MKDHILHDSVGMKCPEQANQQRQKAISACLGVGGELSRMEGSQDFMGGGAGNNSLLKLITVMDTQHCE